MGYVDLGRKLGIGTRVAAKVLRERAADRAAAAQVRRPAKNSPPAPTESRQKPAQTEARRRTDPRQTTRNVTRGVVRGTRQFGHGFWKTFGRAAHALWHEITGVFFAVFAAFFAQGAWNMRGSWIAGADHRQFWIYAVVAALFFYFSITAFVRSRRPSR